MIDRADRLAAPGLAHDAQRLSPVDGEGDAVHGTDDALAGEEVRLEPVDPRSATLGLPVRGSSASRSPSAMKFAQRISDAIAMLGMAMMWGYTR